MIGLTYSRKWLLLFFFLNEYLLNAGKPKKDIFETAKAMDDIQTLY